MNKESLKRIKKTAGHKKLKSQRTIESLIAFPFPCPNCGKPMHTAALFCTDLCKDEAKFVRYFRACIADGRFEQEDVQEALQIQLAHILAGGYQERLRRIPKEIRQAVFKRDNGLCRKCGAEGNQIDHILGNSVDIDNLQLLCAKCHIEKTREYLVPISQETHPEEWAKREELIFRVHLPNPLHLCDSSEWSELWRTVKKRRSELLKNNQKAPKG